MLRIATRRGSQQSITFCVCTAPAAPYPSPTAYVTDLLEVQRQICCYNGNVHQVNHVLMLSPVEVLAYVQRLKNKQRKLQNPSSVLLWASGHFPLSNVFFFFLLNLFSKCCSLLPLRCKGCEPSSPSVGELPPCSPSRVGVCSLIHTLCLNHVHSSQQEFAWKLAMCVCQPWSYQRGYRRRILCLTLSYRANDTASEETKPRI